MMMKYIFMFFLLFVSVLLVSCNNCTENKINPNIENIEMEKLQEKPLKIPFETKKSQIFLSGRIGDITLTFLLDNQFPYDAFCDSTFYEMYNEKELEIWSIESQHVRKLAKKRVLISFDDYTYTVDTVELMHVIKEVAGLIPKNVIGSNLFRNQVVEVNFEERCLLLYHNLPAKVSEYNKYDLIKQQDRFHDGVTIVEFTDGHNTVPAALAFDLGAEMSILNPAIFDKVNINASKKDTTALAYSLLTSSALSHGSIELVTYLAGTREEKNAYSYLGYDGLIGIDFLCQFNVIFDYTGRAVYLKRNNLK